MNDKLTLMIEELREVAQFLEENANLIKFEGSIHSIVAWNVLSTVIKGQQLQPPLPGLGRDD